MQRRAPKPTDEAKHSMALYRELKPGDSLRIGDTVIVAESKSGKATRLRIDTSLEVHQTKAAKASDPPAPATAPVMEEPQVRPTLFRSAAFAR